MKNIPDHDGNRTYDLWNASPMFCQLSYAVRSVRVCDISKLSLVVSSISMYIRNLKCEGRALGWHFKGGRFDSCHYQAYFSACTVWVYLST